ncbi:condensin-2 complex subunit H2-like [Mercenaria mercenaria]|uniref:condensin-2 complex subunit H2-like n=1 Tax=Mercenaria mercenaria TaxID=6596 RepID=UPI00234F3365|nr:condensin-2 complex subunit H2-like [Mercenaria mercenaria]XP_053384023.1 condensin-2 complex subunit H2-like [Mercenaria mercenaria]
MVISASQVEGAEARYAHILQPIKDLTKNWDVDIAAYLEDYLDELEHTTISFDGGVTSMNFAQAALLVQSSACVYSKKVEYLYSLVHQVLETLANKKKQAQKSSVDDEGNDADADFNNDDDDEQFLSLDDIQEGKNLNLKEEFDAGEEFKLLPEMPLCLIPLDEGDKGENPLLSKSGEVLASRNDFKMNTCCIHPQGTLLLDMSHLKLLEQSLKILTELREKNQGEQSNGVEDMGTSDEPLPVESIQDLPGGDSHHDDDNMGDEVDGGPPLADISVNQPMETEHVDVGQDGLRRSERNKEKRPVAYTAKPYVDPWKCLDPHEEMKKAKPVSKKGTIYKLCPGIEDKSKKRKRTKNQLPPRETLSKYIERALYSPAHKFPKNQLKVPTFQDFERLYWEEYKRRQSVREQLKKKEKAVAENNDDEDDNDDNDDAEEIASLPDVAEDDEIEDLVDDNLLNAIDNAVRSNESYINEQPHKTWAETIDEGIIVTSYEDLVRKHVEEYMASAQEYAQITELSKRVSEWEDKVLPILQEEETHRPFDINTYGSSVIDNLDKGNVIKFHKLVQGKPHFEICRTFLASLMLANTTNVRIEEKGTLEEGMDKFELELLSRKRHFEQLQEYTAPSLTQK